MLLQEIFVNNFEILIPEFYMGWALLISILYGVFLTRAQNNQKRFTLATLNYLVIFFLILTILLVINVAIPIDNVILNGVYICDEISKIIKIVLLLSSISIFFIQREYVIDNKINTFEYVVLIIISLLGLMFLVSSYNFIMMYLAIELQSLCFYILAAYQRKSVFSAEAALKYFILGAIASGLILFGTSLIYVTTGSLNFGNINIIFMHINQHQNIELILPALYGLFLVFVGLLFKIGSAPFHYWVPDVYEGSSNNITAFFSIVPKISIVGILLRLFFDLCYDISFFFEYFFFFCSLASILIGSFAALNQKNIKRLLAYSSIGHVGYILIAFVSNTFYSPQNILLYISVYIIMTINFWTILLSVKTNNRPIKFITDLGNLAKLNPVVSLILMLNLFSMAGIPPLAGFFSKMFIFYTAIDAQQYALSIVGILLSVVSAFYYIRIIKITYFDNSFRYQFLTTISKSNSIMLAINIQLIMYFFLAPDIFLTLFEKISLSLFLV